MQLRRRPSASVDAPSSPDVDPRSRRRARRRNRKPPFPRSTTTASVALALVALFASAAAAGSPPPLASRSAAFLPSSSSPSRRRVVGRARVVVAVDAPFGRADLPPLPSSRLGTAGLSLANDENGGGVEPPAVGGELVSALARLDRQWELARRADRGGGGGGNKIGEWTVLDVSGTDDDTQRAEGGQSATKAPEIVYLLEPPTGSVPSCVILFLGGAVLGQFPHVAYSAFLQRLASKVNGSVIAVPYEVGLNHFDLAQTASERFRKAIVECEDRRGYPESIRKYALGHSLGSKLHAISIAATGVGEDLSGIGFVSYNNFGFGQTLGMAKTFAKDMGVGGRGAGGGGFGVAGTQMDFDAIFDFAEQAVDFVGLQFTPSPEDTDRIVSTKFDEETLDKTRLFVFDDDDLDSSEGFLGCCEGERPDVSNLPGTHLTPVYLKLGLDDLPNEAQEIGRQVSGGFENASFGDETNLDALVEEVSGWMLEKGPTRTTSRPMIAGGVVDTAVEE